ncbi:MAG TPA: hypothetical protein VF424_09855 [Vicinamibacterales bacterium]
MIARLSVFVVGCALSVSVAAQQPEQQVPQSTGLQANDAQLDRTRSEVRTFEMVLQQAIESAGQKLAKWAVEIAPSVMLTPAADPTVTGLLLPDSSLIFEVRLAELMPGGLMLYNEYAARVQKGAGRPVATPGSAERVATTGVVSDDPMKTSPAVASTPDKMYSDFVRFSLMDAILDSSIVLSLRDNQWLSVAVVPIDVAVQNPLYRNTSKKLILSIKGEDLAAFRAGKITREEAKQKIVDMRF